MVNFSPTLKKILSNLTWLSVDRVVRLFGAVVVNAMLVRYLGPEKNGIYSFALAFVGMFAPLATLGLDAIVIRDIIRVPERKNEILGSAFGLRLTGALSAFIFAVIGIYLTRPDDRLTQLLVLLSASATIFQAFDVIDYWFQSQVLSKYTVYARNIAFILLNAAKIIFIFANAELYIFVLLSSLEFLVAACGLVVVYQQNGFSVLQWRFRFDFATSLLTNSWPIIISDLAVFAQIRIDQVMIGQFLSNTDVGYYAAAQKVSEPLNFIPMIIMSSVFPVIVKTKEWSEEEYNNRMTNLYRLMFIICMLICIPLAVFSSQIVHILYGKAFAFSGTLLSLLIWSRFYTFFGTARSIFISTENLFKHALICSVSGIIVSVTANYFLLQAVGIYGSIIATHLGFLTTIFIIDGISKRTRVNFKSMILGITTFYKFKIS
ncbi:MAG: flippase [Bacteroidetes bacterium]|nr:flippase [Bacteroidota bacterium]